MCVFTFVESGSKNGKIELQIICIWVILRRFFAKNFFKSLPTSIYFQKKKEKEKNSAIEKYLHFSPGILSSPYHSLTVYVDLLRFEVGAMMTIVGCHNSI